MVRFLLTTCLTLATVDATEPIALIDGRSPQPWRIVNDGVMGGQSQSRLSLREDYYQFKGYLSLANNGGFASVRSQTPIADLSGYKGVVLRVRGDGRSYKLRFRAGRRMDGVAHEARFDTRPETWVEIEILFDTFRPVWRGRLVGGAGPLDASRLRQIGLMVADGQEGPFALDLAWVRAYR